jgi:hypothetical protein
MSFDDKVAVIFMKCWDKYQSGMAVGLPSSTITNNKLLERGVAVLNPRFQNQVVEPKKVIANDEIPSYPPIRTGTSTKGIRK